MTTTAFFTTVSAREFQRNYKSIFAKANKTNQPIMVISNNEPQIVILGLKQAEEYNKFMAKQKFWEVVREIQSKNRYNDPIATQKDIDEAVEEAKQYVYNKTFGRPRRQRLYKRPTSTSKHPRKSPQSMASNEFPNSHI